jgi:C4-dicarboxylate-binding protein DctP
MKKILLLVLVVVVLIALVGCGGNKAKSDDTESSTPPATTEDSEQGEDSEDTTATETEPVEYPELTISLGHAAAEELTMQQGSLAFKELAESESGGNVKVDIFANGALGNDLDMTDSLLSGDLELGLISQFALATVTGMDEILLYDLPWFSGGKGDNMFEIYYNDPAFNIIFRERLEEKGLKLLGYDHIGSYGFNATKSIRSVADAKGMKMRTAENALIVDMFKSLDIDPVVINLMEIFTAIQQGTCDGIYTTDTMMWQTKTYEVADQVTILDNAYCSAFLLVGMDYWNSLDANTQALLEKAGDAYTTTCRAGREAEDQMCKSTFEENGVEVYYLTDEEKQAFSDACEPVRQAWKEKIGADLYDMAADYIATLK